MTRDRQEPFTTRVRQELAGRLPARACDAEAQLSALVMLAATFEETTDARTPSSLVLATRSGAVVRNFFRLVHEVVAGSSPQLHVVSRQASARLRYRVRIVEATRLCDAVGLRLDGGRAHPRSVERLTGRRCDRLAFARGALLAAGSVSGPGREPHVEIAVDDRFVADILATCVATAAEHEPGVSPSGSGWRVVLKSGEAMGTLLAALGAQRAFLEHDERRLRRQLRNEANRLANADSANVRRSITAAANQVEVVERVLDRVGWDALEEDLREVALARLANPEATIAEIGELCDPPVGKSTVHRRLGRIERLAQD